MQNKLADLVLPGNRPIEDVEEPRPLPGMDGDFARRRWWPGATRRLGSDRGVGDWVIVGGGLALAVGCALFPWYIFLNQEEFGVRPLRFEGRGTVSEQPLSAIGPDLVGIRFPRRDELFELDDLATGTVGDDAAAVPAAEQPYPGDPDFRLVHVAAGHALIEDGNGFWIVQPGSWLPDGSRVTSIEERAGKWVLVTSLDTVVPLSR